MVGISQSLAIAHDRNGPKLLTWLAGLKVCVMSTVALSSSSPLREHLRIGPVGIDDWSDVRHVHRISFEKLIGPWLEPEHADAFRERIATPEYVDEQNLENLMGLWFDGQLSGTCGWLPGDDTGTVARMTALFVLPVFTRMGFGRLLLRTVEERTAAAGFQSLMLRSTAMSLGFFEAAGYQVSSQGVATLVPGVDMPVVFMRKPLGVVRPAEHVAA